MPFYDFKCDKCEKIVEDEFFKIADNKYIECCGIQMKQVLLKPPGLSDPGGIGQKWTNDGYQMQAREDTATRIVKEKWVKGENVVRSDVHDSDPNVKKRWNEKVEYVPEKYKKDKNNPYNDPNHAAAKWYKKHKEQNTFHPSTVDKGD